QAEDGIRAFHVTGVQTCALPILGFQLRADRELAASHSTQPIARRAHPEPVEGSSRPPQRAGRPEACPQRRSHRPAQFALGWSTRPLRSPAIEVLTNEPVTRTLRELADVAAVLRPVRACAYIEANQEPGFRGRVRLTRTVLPIPDRR